MNKNVIEIISKLIKDLLDEGAITGDETELIEQLLESGYDLKDIDQAFDIIFSSLNPKEAIKKIKILQDMQKEDFKQRIFTHREKLYFNLEVQNIIIKLSRLNLIKERELEIIIAKSLAKREKINSDDFWELLQDVIDDKFRLTDISNQIEEFNLLQDEIYKYIN